MNLFVGGFPLDIDESKLKNLFAMYGFTVKSVNIIKDKSTGFLRGFAFVTIEDQEEAQRAISKLNGQFLEGSRLYVKEARPKPTKVETYVTPRRWQDKMEADGEL